MHQLFDKDADVQEKREAINELFAQHYELSLRMAIRILHYREDAEDAVQTAYCAAFQHLDTFRGEASFKTWIRRIVVNSCLAQIRERRARPSVGLDTIGTLPILESQTNTPEVLYASQERRTAHAIAASKLPRGLQLVYTPCQISGTPLSDVARNLGLTRAAAKSRLFRARLKVEQALQPLVQGRAA